MFDTHMKHIWVFPKWDSTSSSLTVQTRLWPSLVDGLSEKNWPYVGDLAFMNFRLPPYLG